MKVSIINIKINSIASNGSFNIGKTLIVRPVSNEKVIEKDCFKQLPPQTTYFVPPIAPSPVPPIPPAPPPN